MSRFVVAVFLTALCSANGAAQIASHAPTKVLSQRGGEAAELATNNVAPEKVVARVNGVALTGAQLREKEEAIFPYFKMHGGQIPDSARPEIRERAMHKLVLDELIWQECKRRGMTIPAAKFQQGLREVRKGFASQQSYNEEIKKKYGSEAQFEQRMKRAILVRQLWETEVKKKSVVTEADLRSYYLTNKKMFVRPEAVSIQSISFLLPQAATTDQKNQTRKKAEDCLPKARATKNYEEFGILAESVSEDQWRVNMGDHKWQHKGEVDPQFENIFSMKVGETTGVIESEAGFHILRVNGHDLQRQMTYQEMRDRLRKQLQTERGLDRAEKFEKLLRKNVKVEENA